MNNQHSVINLSDLASDKHEDFTGKIKGMKGASAYLGRGKKSKKHDNDKARGIQASA